MNRHVVVPESVSIINRRTGKPFMARKLGEDELSPYVLPHEDFVNDYILSSPKMSAGGGKGIRRQIEMQKLFEGCKTGGVVAVKDVDYDLCMEIINAIAWAEEFARIGGPAQVLPHIEAWEQAKYQDDEWKRKRDAEKTIVASASVVVPVASGEGDKAVSPTTTTVTS